MIGWKILCKPDGDHEAVCEVASDSFVIDGTHTSLFVYHDSHLKLVSFRDVENTPIKVIERK